MQLCYIILQTFYYTFTVIVIVSDLKVSSLQILHTEHYRVSLCWSKTISFFSNYIPGLREQTLACNWHGWYCQQPSGDCCYWRILLAVRRPPGQWILAVWKCWLGEVSCQLLTHDCHNAASWVADDANTALLDLVAFSLSHRLDDGVGSPADAVFDGYEAPVLTAASRSIKLIGIHCLLAPCRLRVVRIDPLRFLAGCRTRRLNQV